MTNLDFPFDLIPADSRIILYGAGEVCRKYLVDLRSKNVCKLLFIVDRRYEDIGSLDGISVKNPQTLLSSEYDHIVIAAVERYHLSIMDDLKTLGVSQNKIICQVRHAFTKSYTQFGEDVVIKNLFQRIGITKPSYLDVGAYHPIECSNTALFYETGSRGINIDLNTNSIALLNIYRPDDVNLNIAIATEDGEMELFTSSSPNQSLQFSSLSPEATKDFLSNNNEFYLVERKAIKTYSLNTVVEQYCKGAWPDFLTIDAEGLDCDIIESLNFSVSKPFVIEFESNTIPKNTMTFLNDNNYAFWFISGCNKIFVREDIYEKYLSFSSYFRFVS